MQEFDDIRPYQDHEVSEVISTHLNSGELADLISNYKFPKLSAMAAWLV